MRDQWIMFSNSSYGLQILERMASSLIFRTFHVYLESQNNTIFAVAVRVTTYCIISCIHTIRWAFFAHKILRTKVYYMWLHNSRFEGPSDKVAKPISHTAARPGPRGHCPGNKGNKQTTMDKWLFYTLYPPSFVNTPTSCSIGTIL